MRPVLLELGPFKLYSYGVLIALGGLAAIRYWRPRLSKMGIAHDQDFWLLVNSILAGGFVGGRLLYLAEYVPREELLSAALAFNRGFSVLGAFFGVAAAVWLVSRFRKIPFLPLLDHVCVAAPLWHAFGRVGCFLAGCCFGRECALPWAVTFSDPRTLAPNGVPLHPSQIYEAAGTLLLFFFLRPLPGLLKPGRTAGAYFVSYGLLRFFLERFRGDTVPLGDWPLTAGQGISLALAAAGAALLCIPSSSRSAASS